MTKTCREHFKSLSHETFYHADGEFLIYPKSQTERGMDTLRNRLEKLNFHDYEERTIMGYRCFHVYGDLNSLVSSPPARSETTEKERNEFVIRNLRVFCNDETPQNTDFAATARFLNIGKLIQPPRGSRWSSKMVKEIFDSWLLWQHAESKIYGGP